MILLWIVLIKKQEKNKSNSTIIETLKTNENTKNIKSIENDKRNDLKGGSILINNNSQEHNT